MDPLAAENRTLPVVTAASVVVAAAPVGYLAGWLFTVHLVPSETTAVWLTTVAFAVVGLFVAARR